MLCEGTNKLITNYVDMMDVDVAYVGGVWWVVKKLFFSIYLSFVIIVNKMNLKSLPPL